jgi:hypothetical protein
MLCLDSLECDKNKLPKVEWFKQVSGGKSVLLETQCSSRNKKVIEGKLPKGIFVGEGRFQIDWPNLGKSERYFYKAIAGE